MHFPSICQTPMNQIHPKLLHFLISLVLWLPLPTNESSQPFQDLSTHRWLIIKLYQMWIRFHTPVRSHSLTFYSTRISTPLHPPLGQGRNTYDFFNCSYLRFVHIVDVQASLSTFVCSWVGRVGVSVCVHGCMRATPKN